jgi:hypothetical protein
MQPVVRPEAETRKQNCANLYFACVTTVWFGEDVCPVARALPHPHKCVRARREGESSELGVAREQQDVPRA